MTILGIDGKPIKNSNRPVMTFDQFAANLRTDCPDIAIGIVADEGGARAIGLVAGGQPVCAVPINASPETIVQIATVAQKAYEAGYYVAMGGAPETKGEGDER